MRKEDLYINEYTRISRIDDSVCVKELTENGRKNRLGEELEARFNHEMLLTSLIKHPNSVTFLRKLNNHSFEMEQVNGLTLKSFIEYHSYWNFEIPTDVAACITSGILNLLAHLSELKYKGDNIGIVHRDICPNNIMLDTSGNVKVIDYGIAKSILLDIPEDNVVLGSFPYIAPEQLKCADVDARTDIYSTGLVLYELLTLEGPLSTNRKDDIFRLEEIQYKKLPLSLRGNYSKRLSKLISRMTYYEKEDRVFPKEALKELKSITELESLDPSPKTLRHHLKIHFPEIMKVIRGHTLNS